MGLRSLLSVCTLLALCSADQVITTVNLMLDPNRVFWWRTKWAPAPIVLSLNNRSQTSTATFFISPTTSITSGIVEVTFPTGFTVPGTTGLVYQVTGQTLVGGQDYAVQVSGLTNPSTVGAYGPFSIRTRYNTGGQQVDVNLNFGCVYIYGDAGALGSLTVTLAGTTINNVINKSGNTLSFKFTLGVSLWRYDTFVITTDAKWTIASGATCSSADYAGRWNNFNGTNSANPHSLQCFVTPKTTGSTQGVYIYGLAVDGIDLTATTDNQYVDLRVTSVTTPDAVYTGSTYTWTVQTFRFNTATNLEKATYSAGPVVTYDAITTATWAPTWGMAASDLTLGSSYFMDLSFSITNAFPAGGCIDIVVTEDVTTGDSTWQSGVNCYVATYIAKTVTCTINSSTISLAGFPAMPAGSAIKIRNIVKVTSAAGGTAKITSIKTYQTAPSSNVQIDVGSNLSSITIASSTSAVFMTTTSAFGLLFQDTTTIASKTLANLAGGTGTNKQAIQFWVFVNTLADVTSASTITINCPFTSALDDFGIGIPNYATSYVSGGTAGSQDFTSAAAAVANSVTITPSSTSATHGSMTVTGAVGTTVNAGLTMLVGSAASATSFITLPRVINNMATAYECRVAVTRTSVVTYRAAVRFSVSSQAFGTTTFKMPCKDAIAGVPLMYTYLPNAILPTQGSSTSQVFYIEFGISVTSIASGLTIATVALDAQDQLSSAILYPHDKSVSATTTAKIYIVGSSSYVAVTGLPGLTSTSTAVSVYFPIGGLVATTVYTLTMESYYVNTADPRYQFSTHWASGTITATTAVATSFKASTGGAAPLVVSTTNQIVNGETSTTGLTLDIVFASANAADYYFYFVFPTGYTWTTSNSVRNLLTTATTYTGAWFFSSPTTGFTYPGALVWTYVSATSSPNIGTAGAATGSLNISGFKLPLGVPSSTSNVVVTAGSTAQNGCVATSSIAMSPQNGSITIGSISPTSVKARGPDGINIKHVVTFTLQHGIPAGGSISMGVATDWSATGCTKCVVTGLTALTGGINCAMTSNTVSISNFADFSATGSTSVTVEVNNLLAPTSVSGTGTGTNFVTSLSSSTGSLTIDTATVFTNTAVTVTASTAIGATTWTTKKTYPMNAGSTNVDLYLKFSLPHSLPRCGIITITSPLAFKLSGTTVKNSCFLSPVIYNDCSMNGSNLQITLDTDYTSGSVLELFIDTAVDNPTSVTTTATGFSIISTWGGVTVDQDSGTVQSSQTFTATSLLTSTLTGSTTNSLSFAPKTSGEVATYTFDFKDSANYAVGDQFWIVFPPQYDYFLGDTWQWLTNEPNVYYIDCSSTQLGTTWCTVDHNVVVVTGSNAITGSTEIVININSVVNPIVGQTGSFQIFHVDASGNYVTVNQSYGTVTTTAFASQLDVRSLDQTDRRIFKSSDLKWRLYLTDVMNTDSQLKVLFPREYDLNKFDKKDSYSCSTTWYDNSASATIKTQQNWNSASSCTASGNWVTLSSPTTSVTFTATNIVTWTVQSVGNPQWGQSRSALATTQDFDVTDSVLWPLDPFWASKYTFFVYRSSATNLVYTSRSYPNMNAAYAGFFQGYRPILVNGYVPQSKTNRIVVYAGTQTTDLYISTANTAAPMAAKQIVFTPTTNSRTPDSGKLRYTSVIDNWTLFQSFYKIKFRVAAGIDMIKGLYYIDWSNNETKQTGLNDVQYDIPCSTLVEVIAKKAGQYTFGISTIPNVSTGYTSVPIKVTISNPPHTDCTVNISVSGTPANISVTPTALSFNPDVNSMYFQIQVASNFDLTLGTVQTLLFTLTGTDAYSFAIASSVKFTVTQASTTVTTGNVVSWGLSTPAKTSITASPSSDQIGVIYYQLAASGATVPSFSSLKSSVQSLVGSNSTNTAAPGATAGATAGANTQSDPQTGETWIDFQRRLYKTHLESTWVGSISMYATTAVQTLVINWLYAGTTYQISGYLDNLSTSTTDPTVRTETFTTTAIADCQPFIVKFQGLVPQSFSSKIAQEASNVQGVNPLRLYSPVYATSTSRALDTTGTTTTVAFTTFTYTLLPNRFSESPAPADQAKISGTALTSFTSALVADGIANSLNSVANGAVPSRVTPQWTASPSSGGSTTNSVTVSLRSNVAGQACCVALTGTTVAPGPEQVMLGLDATNTAASSTCITSDLTQSSNSVQISSLQAGTAYYVYCSATDSYPMWPTQMSYSSTNPMSPVSITTLGSTTVVVTGASYFGGLFLLLAFLLH